MGRTGQNRDGISTLQIILIIVGVLIGMFVIVGLLGAMAFRGITKARETARKLRCSQQMRDLAVSLNSYEIDRRQYPGYRNILLMTNNESYHDEASKAEGVSWTVPILPYLDYTYVYDTYRTPGGKSELLMASIENLACPSDLPLDAGLPMSYVVNAGCIDAEGTPATPGEKNSGIPRDWQSNGVFFDRVIGNPLAKASQGKGEALVPMVTQTNAWISRYDGMVQTIMLTENMDRGHAADIAEPLVGAIWDINAKVAGSGTFQPGSPPPHATPAKPSYVINVGGRKKTGQSATQRKSEDIPYDLARPSSPHFNGVNVAFCDGHIEFLRDDVDYFVYCLLMSADSKNVRVPGESAPLEKNWFKVPVDDTWLSRY
ncbi:MAG: DUF1559 domain-containing protein [Planctomycetes bacterium]|nr:DUF1559 domain-containing protein [Planctomycetota bacterium]